MVILVHYLHIICCIIFFIQLENYMPVPKRKRSRQRRDKRFANKGLKVKAFSGCSNCEKPLTPHTACKNCGYYKGAKVLKTKTDRDTVRTEHKEAVQSRKKESVSSESEAS